jgi:membrane-bound ClpP family serine protease
MVEVGVALVLVGAALLVVEAHVPAGVIGVAGGATLAVGAVLALSAAGTGVAVIVAAVLATVAVTAAWLSVATRKALAAGGRRASSGREALGGRLGVVRSWGTGGGQVFVDGALWRARLSWRDDEEEDEPRVGDTVVVERVSGLTLAVRRAEEWEEP